jgi:hypothetical protein
MNEDTWSELAWGDEAIREILRVEEFEMFLRGL